MVNLYLTMTKSCYFQCKHNISTIRKQVLIFKVNLGSTLYLLVGWEWCNFSWSTQNKVFLMKNKPISGKYHFYEEGSRLTMVKKTVPLTNMNKFLVPPSDETKKILVPLFHCQRAPLQIILPLLTP